MHDLHFDYSKRTALLFVISLLLYETTTYIANDMIMPGMISVVKSFNVSDRFVSTSLSAFILGGACLQIFLGPLSDRYGRRPVLIVGSAFFLLSTIFVGLSQSISQFIWARFFQGMGLCFIVVVGYAALQEIFKESSAVRIVSIMSSITVAAPLTGPLLGALVIYYFHWRAISLIIAIFASFAFLGLYFYMPETVGKTRRDGSINEMTLLKFEIIKSNYLALIKNKRFMLGSLSIGLASVPVIVWIGTSPLILIKSAGLSTIKYAFYQIPIFICAIAGNFALRFSLSRFTTKQISKTGSVIITASILLTALWGFFYPITYVLIVICMSIYSFGLGLISALLNRITLFSTFIPKGTASALLSLIVMGTTALGNEFAGKVYSTYNNNFLIFYCAMFAILFFCSYTLMQHHSKYTETQPQKTEVL